MNPFKRAKEVVSKPAKKISIPRFWKPKNSIAVESIQALIDDSNLDSTFFILCGLSGILAALGILMNDTAVLISAMVLAPLLNPILAFSAGICLFNRRLILYAFKSIMGSVLFVFIVTGCFAGILLQMEYPMNLTPFIEKFGNLTNAFYMAAFVSGFSAVYAWFKVKSLSHLVGVAIAVSLIPFVSFMGMLLGMGNLGLFIELITHFSINIISIVSGALCAFLVLGVRAEKEDLKKKIEVEISEVLTDTKEPKKE